MTPLPQALPDESTCWQAVCDNDSTYDGEFVYGVQSTRVFCRPSCASRQPKRDNVRFFRTPDEARHAGYRPCKRCNPVQADECDPVAQHVLAMCAYIRENLADDVTLKHLGEQFNLSPYHLQRVFKQVMGISPHQYAIACRMQQFKDALRDGDRVTDAIYSAGFASSSRVYEKIDTHMGMPPSVYQSGGDEMHITYITAPTPFEKHPVMLIARTERGICSIKMGANHNALAQSLMHDFPAATIDADDDLLQEAVQQLSAYFEGWLPHFDLPLDLRVTAFQQRVLAALQRIPYGETRSYGDIAAEIGNPKAARAVGQACNANPVPLVVPCHRVVRSDGSIEGYAYGTELKRHLLDIESQAT